MVAGDRAMTCFEIEALSGASISFAALNLGRCAHRFLGRMPQDCSVEVRQSTLWNWT